MLATLIAEDPSVASDVDDTDLALCERNVAATARALTNLPREGLVQNGVNYPHAYWEGLVAYCQGESAKAEAAFTAARGEVVWDGQAFAPRLMLPLSLSYDHRVVDGAAAARFVVFLARVLGDLRRALL